MGSEALRLDLEIHEALMGDREPLSVGSVTITASERRRDATAALPTLASSSSATAETTTSPRSASDSARSAASNDAARLAFMS